MIKKIKRWWWNREAAASWREESQRLAYRAELLLDCSHDALKAGKKDLSFVLTQMHLETWRKYNKTKKKYEGLLGK